jgi:hypothetical protein
MFSYLHSSGLMALRLPKEEREGFLKKYRSTLFRSQKEYVTVPDHLLQKTAELKKYLDLSYEYVNSLKPKATKRRPKR